MDKNNLNQESLLNSKINCKIPASKDNSDENTKESEIPFKYRACHNTIIHLLRVMNFLILFHQKQGCNTVQLHYSQSNKKKIRKTTGNKRIKIQ